MLIWNHLLSHNVDYYCVFRSVFWPCLTGDITNLVTLLCVISLLRQTGLPPTMFSAVARGLGRLVCAGSCEEGAKLLFCHFWKDQHFVLSHCFKAWCIENEADKFSYLSDTDSAAHKSWTDRHTYRHTNVHTNAHALKSYSHTKIWSLLFWLYTVGLTNLHNLLP